MGAGDARRLLRQFTLGILAVGCLAWLAPGNAAAAATTTYEIVFHAYCHEGVTDVCGQPSEQALEDHWQIQMQGVNEIWRRTNVSFRIAEFEVFYDDTYADIIDENAMSLPLIQGLRSQAAADPGRIWVFLLQDAAVGWSAIPPWSSDCDGGQCEWGTSCNSDDDCGDLFHSGIFLANWCLYNHLAHELGHHFCMAHVATDQDTADDGASITWDGDGLADTPPDPIWRERQNPCDPNHTGFDQEVSIAASCDPVEECEDFPAQACLLDGDLVSGHQWCDRTILTDVDPNGYHQQRCEASCFDQQGSTTDDTDLDPNTALVMGPWGDCIGPYVQNGYMTHGLSQDEAELAWDCIADIPERQAYDDVCSLDTDHDGLCDATDPCPYAYNIFPEIDFDGDGIPDECDNCKFKSNTDQGNVDGDAKGDACDPNIDNDACINLTDLHDYDAQWPVGIIEAPACPEAGGTLYESESLDSDNDGTLNCADWDDDNDNVGDDVDICPLVAYEEDDSDCTYWNPVVCGWEEQVAICIPCPPEFIGRLEWVVNPEYFVEFNEIAVYEDVVYLANAPGLTNSAMVRSFDGSAFPPEAARGPLQLTLMNTRSTDRPVVLARYNPGELELGSLDGRAVAVTIRDGRGPRVEGTWSFGQLPGDVTADADRDGVPDPADNCLIRANPAQTDRNGNGYGDACDADFEEDGVIDARDVAFVERCVGVAIGLLGEVRCGVEGPLPHSAPPDIETVLESVGCAAADLDRDGAVTEDDLELAARLEGRPPGPSGAGERAR